MFNLLVWVGRIESPCRLAARNTAAGRQVRGSILARLKEEGCRSPIYRRIADDLRVRIESGALAPGSQLPTELALQETYRVSRNTVRDALKWLLRRGLVETRHGQGTFVASQFKPFITTLPPDWQVEMGAQRLLDATEVSEAMLKYLERTLGITQIGYRDQILVRPSREDEMRFFRLQGDGQTSMAVLLRTGFTPAPDGPAPYRFTETMFPADRTQFVINEGAVPDRLAAAAEV